MLIDWFTVAAQAANFLILVWLLKRFLYKPVLAAIDEREKHIASRLQEAEEKMRAAGKEQADFVHRSEEFDQQRSSLLQDAKNAANAEREELLATARKDAEQLRNKMQTASEAEVASLNEKIRLLVESEVFAIARKALADLADTRLEERMTTLFIDRLYGLSDKERESLKSLLQPGAPALVRSTFEIAPAQRSVIQDAVKTLLPDGMQLGFETKADLICGIELATSGQKIGWNIAGYLSSLAQSLDALAKPKSEPDPLALKVLPHAA